MRITSHHLIDLAASATSRAQDQVADATRVASTGLAVAVPSDDVASWVMAARDRVRQTISAGAGVAIADGRDRLQQTDGALATISGTVSRAREIAIQGNSAALDPSDRAALALEARALYSEALSAANTQGANGTYLLAGAQSQTPPFDATGTYAGDTNVVAVASGDGTRHDVAMTGDLLTAAHGVDVLPAISKLGQALDANDPVAIQAAIGELSTAVGQLAAARAHGGAAATALDQADDARRALEQQLTATASRLVEADAVGAASRLAQASQALAVSQAVSAKVIASLASGS